MVNVPNLGGLLNTLPAVREAGKFNVPNKIPDILAGIMADKTRNRAINSQERISQDDIFARAQAQDKALALEGEKLRANQEQAQLDREAQLENTNRQIMGGMLDSLVKEYGIESLGQLRGIIPGFAAGQDEKLPVKDIDLKSAIEGLDSVTAPTNPRAFGEDIFNKYNSGEIKGTDAIIELSKKSGRYFENLKSTITDLERIKKADPSVNAEKIQQGIKRLESGEKTADLLTDYTVDELDLVTNLFNSDQKSFSAEANVIEKVRQGGSVDEVTYVKAADKLKNKNILSDDETDTAESYRQNYLNNLRSNISSIATNIKKAGDSEAILAKAIPQMTDAKTIADDKYYKQYIYAPVRNAYEDRLRGKINVLNTDKQVEELEKFLKFEQNLGNKNLVSVPILQPSKAKASILGSYRDFEITGFRVGSPAEAKRVINELKRRKDANNE